MYRQCYYQNNQIKEREYYRTYYNIHKHEDREKYKMRRKEVDFTKENRKRNRQYYYSNKSDTICKRQRLQYENDESMRKNKIKYYQEHQEQILSKDVENYNEYSYLEDIKKVPTI